MTVSIVDVPQVRHCRRQIHIAAARSSTSCAPSVIHSPSDTPEPYAARAARPRLSAAIAAKGVGKGWRRSPRKTAPTSFCTCGRQRLLPMLPAHTRADAFVSLCSCRFLPQATEVLM